MSRPRRLLRRCMLLARRLAMPGDWYERGIARLVDALGEPYPELAGPIAPVIADEVGRFERTLAVGLHAIRKRRVLDGKAAFDLFQTHGFPLELTRELAESTGTPIDEAGYRDALERHANSRGSPARARSRAASRTAPRRSCATTR